MWLGLAAYSLQMRFFINFLVPLELKKEDDMQRQLSNVVFIFVFVILNFTIILKVVTQYIGFQIVFNALGLVFGVQYKIVGNDFDKFWTSFLNIVVANVPSFICIFFYFALNKLMLENNIKVVIEWNRE